MVLEKNLILKISCCSWVSVSFSINNPGTNCWQKWLFCKKGPRGTPLVDTKVSSMFHNHKQNAYTVMMERSGLKLNSVSQKRLSDMYERVAIRNLRNKHRRKSSVSRKEGQGKWQNSYNTRTRQKRESWWNLKKSSRELMFQVLFQQSLSIKKTKSFSRASFVSETLENKNRTFTGH